MPVTYKKIATVTISTATAANMGFTNIPANYTDLVIKVSTRTNRANAVDALGYTINGDTTAANYSGRTLRGDGTNASSTSFNPFNDEALYVPGNNATASTFGNTEIYIPNYAGNTQKSLSADSVGENNATTAFSNIGAALYNQTAAITSITIKPITGTALLQYSTAVLYGIKKD